jgi:hypothetical protein
MGNCQAAEAEAVVIQHPGGKVERLYGAATAAEVMRGNPGHYVALVVLRVSAGGGKQGADPDPSAGAVSAGAGAGTRITKVKLLKPRDVLLLGQVYRLITSQGAYSIPPARLVLGLDDLFLGSVSFLPSSISWWPTGRARRGGEGDTGEEGGQDAAVRGRRGGGGGRPAGSGTTRRRGGQPRAGAVQRRPGTEAAGEVGPAAPDRR